MKKILSSVVTLILVLTTLFMLSACTQGNATPTPTPAQDDASTVIKREGLWANATYIEDTTFGTGAKTLTLIVEADGKKVTFTVKSDKETVGQALIEHSLIAGDIDQYGMYVKSVNGIQADYDIDKAYWAFNKDGKYMMSGVDTTEFVDGDKYEFVYTKG